MIRQFFDEGQRENRNGVLSDVAIFHKAFVFANLFSRSDLFFGAPEAGTKEAYDAGRSWLHDRY